MTAYSLSEIVARPMTGDRRRSPIERTGEPVRRQSFRADRPAPGYRCKITRKEAREIVLAATVYDRTTRTKGKRPLGRAALQILEFLANMAAYSGRVEPSYEYIMDKVGCARDTITRALKSLRAHGFLDWIRRYVPTGNAEGPQVQQTSNAYRLTLPAIAKRLLGRILNPAPVPEDIEHEAQERAQQIEAMRATLTMREQLSLDLGAESPLGDALARLWDSMQKRESEKQGVSRVTV